MLQQSWAMISRRDPALWCRWSQDCLLHSSSCPRQHNMNRVIALGEEKVGGANMLPRKVGLATEEMCTSLDTVNLPNWTVKTGNLNRPIKRKEFESAIKPPKKEKPRTRLLHRWTLPNFQGRRTNVKSSLVRTIEREGTLRPGDFKARQGNNNNNKE